MTIPDKYQNKYRIASTRLQNWDYGQNAAYFVTICTKDRINHFGNIEKGQMNQSKIGEIAEKYWHEITNHFSFVTLDIFVIMPNHIHGILIVNKPNNVETRQCLVSTDNAVNVDQNTHKTNIGKNRFQNQGKNTLSSIIGSYKSAVAKYSRRINQYFAWQTRFYEHIIRDEESYNQILEYIQTNPLKWQDDKYYTQSSNINNL